MDGKFMKSESDTGSPVIDFPYPCEVVSAAIALERLDAIRSEGIGTPIILGGKEQLESARDSFGWNKATVDQLLALADKLDPIVWLGKREQDEPVQFDLAKGDWPEHVPHNQSSVTLFTIQTKRPQDEIYITVLPDAHAWKAACFLKIGNWNAMPSAPEHSALWRYWEERYGSKVACIANDVIEFTVAQPPKTRDEALALAKQQFIYCNDLVDQGVGAIEGLAATLLQAGSWFFWWD